MAVVISATEQAVYPPRVIVALTGLTLGDEVSIYREVAGNRTAVRAGSVASATDTGFAAVDAELPFGVSVRYVAVVEGVEYATSLVTYTLPGGKVALSDAITGLAAEVIILAADARNRTRDAARFRVAGRNVVVGQPMSAPEGSYELFTETTSAHANLIALLAAATEGIVQIRQPGGYDDVDAYLSVDQSSVTRWSQDGSDPRRRTTIQYAEVEPWPAGLAATGWTYGEVEAFYSGVDYATAAGDYPTYLDAILGDFS